MSVTSRLRPNVAWDIAREYLERNVTEETFGEEHSRDGGVP